MEFADNGSRFRVPGSRVRSRRLLNPGLWPLTPGFTLVELLVVILILAALMVIAIPRYFRAVYEARVRGCQADVQIINTATQAFFARNKVWPTTVDEMCESVAPSWVVAPPLQEMPVCPFGVPYELSPMLQDGSTGAPTPGNPQVGVALNVDEHFEGSWKTAKAHR
ncbi:MAG: type II secretion system protein [Armatimonadota bacterium]